MQIRAAVLERFGAPLAIRTVDLEGAGVVEKVGDGVTSLAVGDHVVTLFSPQCRECIHCQSDRTNLCLAIREQRSSAAVRSPVPDASHRRERTPPACCDLRFTCGEQSETPAHLYWFSYRNLLQSVAGPWYVTHRG